MSNEEIAKNKDELVLLNIKDVMRITGWGKKAVIKLMAQEDFPLIKIGKKNQVSFESLKEYLSCRRDLRGK